MVGRLLSYWEGTFSGAMLNFAGVFKVYTVNVPGNSAGDLFGMG